MGKLTISMAIFNSYFDITRGYLGIFHGNQWCFKGMILIRGNQLSEKGSKRVPQFSETSICISATLKVLDSWASEEMWVLLSGFRTLPCSLQGLRKFIQWPKHDSFLLLHPILSMSTKINTQTHTHTHTVNGRIPAPPKGWLKPINNGMFTTFQRVQDFFHPQYHNL